MARRPAPVPRRRRGDRFRAGKRLWSRADDEQLRREYPHTETAKLAKRLRRTPSSTSARAQKLGIAKSPDFMRRLLRDCGKKLQSHGACHRFARGHVPANKGLRRPGYAPGRMKTTQFRKGEKPHTWKQIGSERVVDGYLQRKVTDTGYPPRDWRPVHVLLWERKMRRRVPKGHAIAFRNGDRTDIRIENLELVSRRELMARNTVHNLPAPLVEVVRLRGVLKQQINRRSRP